MGLGTAREAIGAALAVSIVLAGGGAAAVTSTAGEICGVQRHVVELTATTQENLDDLATLLSGENPLTKAVGELSQQYSTQFSGLFGSSMKGVEQVWTGDGGNVVGLEHLVPIINDFVAQGNITEAYNQLNNDMLFDMLNIFQPWFTHETFHHSGVMTDGILTIPVHISQDLTNLSSGLVDYSLWSHALESLASPIISMNFALTDQFTDTGTHQAQNPLDAFLNGYVPWEVAHGHETVHAPLIGLLTEGGPFDYFGRQVPEQLAGALLHGGLPDMGLAGPGDESDMTAEAAVAIAGGDAASDLI